MGFTVLSPLINSAQIEFLRETESRKVVSKGGGLCKGIINCPRFLCVLARGLYDSISARIFQNRPIK